MLFQPASSSWSCAVSPQSPALTVGHQNEMLESASCSRVMSARSAFVDWRRSRVWKSTISTPHPSVVQ